MVWRTVCNLTGLLNSSYTASSIGKFLVISAAIPLLTRNSTLRSSCPGIGSTRSMGRFLASASETVSPPGLETIQSEALIITSTLLTKPYGLMMQFPSYFAANCSTRIFILALFPHTTSSCSGKPICVRISSVLTWSAYPMLPPINSRVRMDGSIPSCAAASLRASCRLNFGCTGMPNGRMRSSGMPRLTQRYVSSSLAVTIYCTRGTSSQ